MIRRAAAAVVLSALSSLPVLAQSAAEHPWCGTSREVRDQVRELSSWMRRAQFKTAPAAIDRVGDLLVLAPDAAMIPFDHLSDLEGRSVAFERKSASTYAVRTTALQYESQTGALLATFDDFENPNEYVKHTLQRFTFPFGSQTVRDLYISERLGIFLAPPASATGRQYWLIDPMTLPEAVIGPYLGPVVPGPIRGVPPQVRVRETEDRVIITWTDSREPDREPDPMNGGDLDIQAVIERDGDITFSYRTLFNLGWGSVVVTTGQSPQRQPVASANDAVGDSNSSSALANLLDIRRVELLRAGGSELMSLRIQLGGAIRPQGGSTPRVAISAVFDTPTTTAGNLLLNSSSQSWQYCTPGRLCRTSGGSVEFGADSVTLHFLDRDLLAAGNMTVRVQTSEGGRNVDSASLSFSLTRGTRADRDLSALTSETTVPLPIVEAFTLPPLNVDEVWLRIRDELELWDEEVDGVAIFQNFPTDIIQFASAYSTVGNSGADGVWAESEGFYGSDVPKFPALLHMNRIVPAAETERRRNFRQFLLAHEFGHRWLYGFTIIEDGAPSWNLAPLSAHPAEYVHTPAAFNVITETDYSVMGGSNFRELSPTTFATPLEDGAWGYSWHELYLMGLAAPTEVPDWFYIADSDPPLELAYNAPPDITVTGRKVPVTFHQLTDSMGGRWPEERESQKTFRLLVVLLQKPSETAAEEVALLSETLERFPHSFSNATGGRGSLVVTTPVKPQAVMDAPGRAFAGVEVAFRDESADFPARWRWEFGDGQTSDEQHPKHVYRNPGTYPVKLTVENSRGSSSVTGQIVIERGTRRRPTRN